MNSLSPTYAGSIGLVVKGRNVRRYPLFLFACIFLTWCATSARAQEATILGTVSDPTGAAVPNASIVIVNTETGVSRTLTSNSDGQYVAPDLHIGHYSVTATATGFKSAAERGITLDVGDRSRIDFKLEVGSAQEQVTVEANGIAVQTDTSEQSNIITGQQVTQLASNGRSVLSLFALAPGASSLTNSRAAFTPVSGDNAISVNGERVAENLQLIDGGENLDRGGSGGSVSPSIDAIAEFQNLTSNYSAEYGLASAETVSMVIKSGTKQFHASAWEFFRNDDLNARNYFNRPPSAVAEFRYNVFGFNAGGQVPVDKAHPTFFFYNMEWRREIDGGLINQLVPPASGYPDASGAGTGAVLPTTFGPNDTPTIASDPALSAVPASVQFANCPGGVAPAGVVPGSPFPNNTIPDCMISPNAKVLLTAGGKYGGIFPQPNSPNDYFFGGNNSPTDLREEVVRIDHTFSSKFSVFGHFIAEQISQTYGTTQWSNDNVPSVADVFGNPSYSAAIHATHTISPTVLNEIAFNYNGNRIHIIPNNLVSAPSTFTFNRLFDAYPNVQNRIPAIQLTGTTGSQYTSNWTPWNNAANDYQIRDDLSWTKGTHQLRFGFGFAIYKKVQDAFADTEGQFTFKNTYTGYDFADFLLGYGYTYQEDGAQISGHWNNISPDFYVQDNWRATNRLTINAGLRWDGIPHTYEANHLSSNFYPNLYNFSNAATFDSNGNICSNNSVPACAGGPSPGLVAESNFGGYQFYLNGIGIGGVNGVPKGLVNGGWQSWGPRLGFAYDLTGNGKTVLRAGYGVMYERVQGNDMYNGATNPPGDPSPTLFGASLDNPGLNIATGNTITASALPVLPLGITGVATNYTAPRSSQFSAGLQRAIGSRGVLNVSYVGDVGRHLNYYQAINLPPLTDLGNLVNTKAGTANGLVGGPTLYEVLGYPGIGQTRLSYDGANSKYNSLQVSLNGHITHDLYLQTAYTLSKAWDTSTSSGSGGDLQNVTNPYLGWRADWGPSIYDRRDIFFANLVYDIPAFRNSSRLLKSTLGGWQFSAIVTEETGAPVNLGLSTTNASSVISNSGDRPNINGSISYPHTTAAWFNTSVFSAPTCAPGGPGTDCYGNLGFNAITGPGRNNFDLALMKNFSFSERARLEFRAEAFNTFNHPQFQGNVDTGGLGNNFGSAGFGVITQAYDPREFQLALKLIF